MTNNSNKHIKTFEELNFSKIKRKVKSQFGKLSDEEKFIEIFFDCDLITNKSERSNFGLLYGKVPLSDNITIVLRFDLRTRVVSLILNTPNSYQGIQTTKQLYEITSKIGPIKSSDFGIPGNFDIRSSYSMGGIVIYIIKNDDFLSFDFDINLNDFVNELKKLDIEALINKAISTSPKEENGKELELLDDIKDYLFEIEEISNNVKVTKKSTNDKLEVLLEYNIEKLYKDGYIDMDDDIIKILSSAKKRLVSLGTLEKFAYKFHEKKLLVKIIIKYDKD